MGISKVVYGDKTLIDLTTSSVNAESLLEGVTAHAANGEIIVGTAKKINDDVAIYQQENAMVQDYLAAADAAYTDSNGVSVTVMPNYASADNNYDDPLGYKITPPEYGTLYLFDENDPKHSFFETVGIASYVVYNLIPGHTYRYFIANSSGKTVMNGRLKATGDLRMIYMSGTDNCRDLGGWDCAAGKVKYGMLYRSMNLTSTIQSNKDILLNILGIKHEVDFRQDAESANMADSFLGATVTYARFPMDHNSYQTNVRLDNENKWYENTSGALVSIMENTVLGNPTLLHCSIGCDRTGTICFLLEAILGLSKADIDKEYELSALSGTVGGTDVTSRLRTRSDWNNMVNYLNGFNRADLHKNVIAWCNAVGIPALLVNQFRAAMCTDTPAQVVYTNLITTNLVETQLSSNPGEVETGSSFTATVSGIGSAALDTVTVYMGGVDITSTAYNQSTGVISIPSVTGDIVINAVAELPYTNQIPISTSATSSDVYNGIGYQDGKYLSSGSNGESTDSTFFATGFIPYMIGKNVESSPIYVKGADWTSVSHCRMGFYKSDKSLDRTIAGNYSVVSASGTYFKVTVLDATDKYWKLEPVKVSNGQSAYYDMYGTSVEYIRFSLAGSGAGVVVTINEEIV